MGMTRGAGADSEGLRPDERGVGMLGQAPWERASSC